MSVAMSDFSKTRYTNIFTTPLITHTWEDGPELNALLRERILAHEAQNRGIAKSNHGGWHSETGQLEFCGDSDINADFQSISTSDSLRFRGPASAGQGHFQNQE